MIQYIRRYRKLKQQLKAIAAENWDGRLDATEWNDWPLMQQAVAAMEQRFNVRSMELLKRKQAEYLALQNQINPHFLYNTLEAIRGDALCEGAKGIADTTKALATFFRYTITEVGYEVTLEDELNNIENYFLIQQYRFGDKMRMDIQIPKDNEELLHARIPKLTLQPLVENAVSHGLENKVGSGRLTVVVECSRTNLYLSIEDDGIGIEREQLEQINQRFRQGAAEQERDERGGIALVNVNSRIQLLYGSEYGLHVYSVAGTGTKVRVTLPLLFGIRG